MSDSSSLVTAAWAVQMDRARATMVARKLNMDMVTRESPEERRKGDLNSRTSRWWLSQHSKVHVERDANVMTWQEQMSP